MTDCLIATTPEPPYYAVIFSSIRTGEDQNNYQEMASYMLDLATEQPGFLGVEHAREKLGITVSYWADEESILQWRNNADHAMARKMGRDLWYRQFCIRVAKVEREYGMPAKPHAHKHF